MYFIYLTWLHFKFNLKGKYDKLECRACKIEEETQKHIVECKVLSKEKEKVEYEKIYEGTVIEKLIITRKFQKNYEILEEEFGWNNEDRKFVKINILLPNRDHVTEYFSCLL